MKVPPISVLAHSIRSTHNVGSIFRTCDAAGVSKLYLSGYTACPPRDDIAKTALGAQDFVPWEYHQDPVMLLKKLKAEGVQIVALERAQGSQNITHFKPQKPFCLIVGNEVEGVEKSLLELADVTLEIPMHGKKESLNVSVAFGVAIYFLSL